MIVSITHVQKGKVISLDRLENRIPLHVTMDNIVRFHYRMHVYVCYVWRLEEKTAKREESWGPTRAAKCAPIDRFASWSTSFAWIMVILGSNLRSFLSSSSSSSFSIMPIIVSTKLHEHPILPSVWWMKIASHTDEFSFFDLEIANRRKFMIFLSFFLETWKKKKKGRDTELFLQWFWRILSSSVNNHRRLKERNRLGDIPTVSLIFNRLDSWQQLFNVLGRGNGSRGHHLCA